MVGALSLALPVIYTHHYAMAENVPLDILSGNMIATYPAMLAILVFISLLLIVFALLPALVLLTPLNGGGSRLIDPVRHQPVASPGSRRVLCHWLMSQLAYTILLWLASLALTSPLVPDRAWIRSVLGILTVAICIMASP